LPPCAIVILMMDHALILLAHGSREASANEAVRKLASELGRLTAARASVAAFLQRASPDLAEAVAELVRLDVPRLLIVPYFTMAGVHLRRDLPQMAAQLAQRYPKVRIQVTRGFDDHPAVLQILHDRVREALELPGEQL